MCVILLDSCSKSEIPTFTDLSADDLVNLNGEEAEISFDLIPDTIVTYDIKAVLSGLAVDYDREITIATTEATTATEGTHYTLTESVVPANKVEGECKLRLLAPEKLKEGDSLIIELEVLKSGELLPGINTKLRYKIVAGLPNAWSSWMGDYCFGAYSKVKFKFLIDIYGSVDAIEAVMSSWNWGPHQFYVYKELQAYKEAHGGNPLMDENGIEVTVPVAI